MAVNGTTDLWADLSEFLASIGVGNIRGRIVLCDKAGNFRVRIGIQTYDNIDESTNAPTSIASGTGYGYLSTVAPQFVDFVPNASGNGDIDAKAGFRVGVLYSSTDSSVSRGDVLVELYADA